MKPLQIWLPLLGASTYSADLQRDRQRAYQQWCGETTVYFLPELDQPARWKLPGDPWSYALALPAEHLDRVDVFHISQRGLVTGYGASTRFPEASVQSLLDAWLNVYKIGGVDLVPAPASFTMQLPRFAEGQVVCEDAAVSLEPGATMPFVHTDPETRSAVGAWPPVEVPRPTVSPETESLEYFSETGPGRERPEQADGGGDTALRRPHVISRWPEPLSDVMSMASSLDDIFAQTQMENLVRASSDLEGALREARRMADPYVSSGWTTQECSWFLPTLMAEGIESVLVRAEAKFGVEANSWEELVASPKGREVLATRVEIRRAWGAVGLFWCLLIDSLEERRPFTSCGLCDRMIRGRRAKEFCGRDDDRKCFNGRRAADKRRSRDVASRH